MTNFDVRHCHKWAQLLTERKAKLNQAVCAIEKQDFDSAKKLSNQIFAGVMGKQADPGMAGSFSTTWLWLPRWSQKPKSYLTN